MFRSFAVKSFRLWFIGALIAHIGLWMQATAQSWVVLTELTDNNASAIGLILALLFGPPVVLFGVVGTAAERLDRRSVLIATQSTMCFVALGTGLLLSAGVMTLPLMCALVLLLGIAMAFDTPIRQAYVSDLVGAQHISNAVALNSASLYGARMVGPAVAGLMIAAVGSQWVFLANAALYLPLILILTRLPSRQSPLAQQERVRMREGFGHALRRRDLLVVFVVVLLMGTFGMNFQIFASTMTLEFDAGPDAFGIMSSVVAVGSLMGSLAAARLKQPTIAVMIGAAAVFGVAIGIASAMPTFPSFTIMLVPMGFAAIMTMTVANGYVHTSTPERIRGRVLALYFAVLGGGTPIGAPIMGRLIDAWGPRAGLMAATVTVLIGAGLGALAMRGRPDRTVGMGE